jgi:cation diffusion facilitator family transporter
MAEKNHRHDHAEPGHPHHDGEERPLSGAHAHTHGAVDPSILTTERGIWAIKWSFAALFATAVFQLIVVWLSGSVALLADTIHNFGDAATAIPLFVAFTLARWKPTKTFTYGFGRVEDLAGVIVVLTILASAVIAAYESIQRLIAPEPVVNLWIVVIASIVGFAGNEGVALFRIKVGREIGSAALIADGYHARTDGLTSLAVLGGAAGVWLGFPLADPIVGLLITVMILKIVWDSAKLVFTRLLGGVDPEVADQIAAVARGIPAVADVTEVRVSWLGHRMHAEVNITVNSDMRVSEAHGIAVQTRNLLLERINHLSSTTIHVDPLEASGEGFHLAEKEH